jgi:hypothetical protein
VAASEELRRSRRTARRRDPHRAPTIEIQGSIGANGGGGGQGNGADGEGGHWDTVAKGGNRTGKGPTAGDGSFGTTTAGTDGVASDGTSGAAGGAGGAGRIRFNTQSGAATFTGAGAVSPATGTPCFTQGKLK